MTCCAASSECFARANPRRPDPGLLIPDPRSPSLWHLGWASKVFARSSTSSSSEPLEPTELLDRLKAVAPPGFDWIDARPLPPDARPPTASGRRVFVPCARGPPRRVHGLPCSPCSRVESWPFDPQATRARVAFRSAPAPDLRPICHGRGPASFSFESCIRWLSPSRRTARSPCDCATSSIAALCSTRTSLELSDG